MGQALFGVLRILIICIIELLQPMGAEVRVESQRVSHVREVETTGTIVIDIDTESSSFADMK